MRYKAEVACTDFDGVYYPAGAIVELSENVKHSSHLIAIKEKQTQELPTEEDSGKKTSKKSKSKTKITTASVQTESK